MDFKQKKVFAIEKQEEKTLKYGPLRWGLKRQYQSFQVTQHNIIIDVLCGYSKSASSTVKELVGSRNEEALKRIQKSIISNGLNIARSFKVQAE